MSASWGGEIAELIIDLSGFFLYSRGEVVELIVIPLLA